MSAGKYIRQSRVVLASDPKYHGYVYDLAPQEYNDTNPPYYYVQWDKGGKYQYSEEMLLPEPKLKGK